VVQIFDLLWGRYTRRSNWGRYYLIYFVGSDWVSLAFAGLAAHLARVVPNTAIMFTCYELVVRIWKKHHMKSASGE
jgi:hypothetical protein